ncbi:MAG: ATP-binding protein [Flavobacteriales bacterium]
MVNDQIENKIDFSDIAPLIPFMMAIGPSGDIVYMGPSLQKSLGRDLSGFHVEDGFQFLRPGNWQSLPEADLHKYILFLKEKGTELSFKGQALKIENQITIIALNPLLSASTQIKDFNLSIGDFPVYDTIAEYLFLRQTNSNGLREAALLNTNLISKNKALESARIELSKINADLEQKVSDRTRELHVQMKSLEESKLEIEKKSAELQDTLEKLKRAQFEIIAKEKMSMLGQLVSGIAHEINTPLGSIKAAAYNLNFTIEFLMSNAATSIPKEQLNAVRELFIAGERKDFLPNEIFDKTRLFAEEIKTNYPSIPNVSLFASKALNSGIDNIHHPFIAYIIPLDDRNLLLDLTSELHLLYQGLNTIQIAAERASKVVTALKTYVHTDIHESYSVFNIKEQVDSVLLLFINATKRGIQIQNKISSDINFNGSADQLTQVWTNLLSNAIHAVNQQGKIELNSSVSNGWLQIEVSNDGPPIPEEVRAHIFEPFYTTKERGIGTGLGLNIIHKIIEQHGGTICCESDNGLTKFIVKLPFAE